MRTISLFFSILLSLTAFGQPSPINRRAFALAGLARSSVNPTNPSTIVPNNAFWWNVDDLATNTTSVNSWTDRINQIIITNTGGGRPTYSTNAVHFTRSVPQLLTNIVVQDFLSASRSNTLCWMIVKPDSKTGIGSILGAEAGSGSIPYYGYNGPGQYTLFTPVPGQGASGPDVITGQYSDVGIVLINTNLVWFTNGISCFTNDWTFGGTFVGSFKTIGAEVLAGTIFQNGYDGYLNQIFCATNAIGLTNMISVMQQFHWYATNTYPWLNITP